MLKSHLFSASVNSRNNSVGEKFTENNMEYIQKGNIMHQEYLYWRLSESESINLCKQQVDTMERWSRRLIDETFSAIFGKDYLTVKNPETNESLFKTDLLNKINARCKNDSARYPRQIDAIVIEDLIYIFCKDNFYSKYFKDVFEPFYSGREEVKQVLTRISNIRNKYSHGCVLSQHEIEQCICYSNDLIEVYKSYYQQKGKEREYNVPVFISFKDSLGNYVIRDNPYEDCGWEIFSSTLGRTGKLTSGNNIVLRSGESYRLELVVDSSFPSDFYKIDWSVSVNYSEDGKLNKGSGNIIEFSVNDKSVSYRPTIIASLKTKRSWHRFGKYDDHFQFTLGFILPPIEDTF